MRLGPTIGLGLEMAYVTFDVTNCQPVSLPGTKAFVG